MIIPVRCFTCGKVLVDGCNAVSVAAHVRLCVDVCIAAQVIGNKWDTYLDLLQAGYSEQ